MRYLFTALCVPCSHWCLGGNFCCSTEYHSAYLTFSVYLCHHTLDWESLGRFLYTQKGQCFINSTTQCMCIVYEASQYTIHFLDLKIWCEGDELLPSTYFKTTDRNSFIPRDSCHHSSWLDSVPKSQFVRMRRNCTRVEDFNIQAKILTDRFIEKGYEASTLNQNLCKSNYWIATIYWLINFQLLDMRIISSIHSLQVTHINIFRSKNSWSFTWIYSPWETTSSFQGGPFD